MLTKNLYICELIAGRSLSNVIYVATKPHRKLMCKSMRAFIAMKNLSSVALVATISNTRSV